MIVRKSKIMVSSKEGKLMSYEQSFYEANSFIEEVNSFKGLIWLGFSNHFREMVASAK